MPRTRGAQNSDDQALTVTAAAVRRRPAQTRPAKTRRVDADDTPEPVAAPASPAPSESPTPDAALAAAMSEEIMEQRRCTICRDLVTTRHMLSRGAVQCMVCSKMVHETCSDGTQCPTCRADHTTWSTFPMPSVPTVEQLLCHQCEYCNEKIHTSDAIDRHVRECPEAPAACVYEKCSFMAKRGDVAGYVAHLHASHPGTVTCTGARSVLALPRTIVPCGTYIVEIAPAGTVEAALVVHVTNKLRKRGSSSVLNASVMAVGSPTVATNMWICLCDVDLGDPSTSKVSIEMPLVPARYGDGDDYHCHDSDLLMAVGVADAPPELPTGDASTMLQRCQAGFGLGLVASRLFEFLKIAFETTSLSQTAVVAWGGNPTKTRDLWGAEEWVDPHDFMLSLPDPPVMPKGVCPHHSAVAWDTIAQFSINGTAPEIEGTAESTNTSVTDDMSIYSDEDEDSASLPSMFDLD
jgi:hypothetical protein